MKIALLSPFLSQNYGTVLQAFALAKKIQELGVTCEYLDWYYFNPSLTGRIRFLLKHPLFYISYRTNLRKNTEFVEKQTPVANTKVAVDDFNTLLYDKFIVGSDQTWSPDSLYQYSPFFLRSLSDNQKKYSYASSMGKTEIPICFQSFLKKNLRKFSNISCREKKNSALLSKLLKKDIPCVLDPTLLLKREQWCAYMKPVDMPEEFVLCYILGEKRCISDYAEVIAKKKELPVYYIDTRPNNYPSDKVLRGVGVQEFIWLINHCSMLVTDSFHGTIFAINFEKNVVAFDKHTGSMYDNGRIKEVLSMFQIESQYSTDNYKEVAPEIDYDKVTPLLEQYREVSIEYLKNIVLN